MNELVKTAENEVIRREILELCQQAAPYGAGIPVLKASLRKLGYNLTDQELQVQTAYLTGKKLLEKQTVENRRLSISRDIYFLTPEGTDFLEGNGQDVTGVG